MPGWGAEENKHRRFRRIQKAPELKCVVDGQSSNCAAILPFEHAMNTGLKSFPSPPFHGALCWSCCVPWALVFTLLLVLCFALLYSDVRVEKDCVSSALLGWTIICEALSHSPDSHGPPACFLACRTCRGIRGDPDSLKTHMSKGTWCKYISWSIF